MNTDEIYMSRCLQLAGFAKGFAAPNPMVGSVVVCDGRVIGEGFHRRCGEAHAEVNAIASVRNPELLKRSTLYVNLEPCSHYGKTPPCAQLIVDRQIPRVVVGIEDPFPEVSGRGIRRLREAGVEVEVGVLADECRWLNRRFLTFHARKRPYIILKWAQSADGFMDRQREVGDGQKPVRFSNDYTQAMAHKLRAEEAAIMVGKRTAMLDEPKLNVRYWSGSDPLRILADSCRTLKEEMSRLYGQGFQSLIVEGGAALLQSFLNEGLWDEIRIETSSFALSEGVKAPMPVGKLGSVQKCEKSTVSTFLNPVIP